MLVFACGPVSRLVWSRQPSDRRKMHGRPVRFHDLNSLKCDMDHTTFGFDLLQSWVVPPVSVPSPAPQKPKCREILGDFLDWLSSLSQKVDDTIMCDVWHTGRVSDYPSLMMPASDIFLISSAAYPASSSTSDVC